MGRQRGPKTNGLTTHVVAPCVHQAKHGNPQPNRSGDVWAPPLEVDDKFLVDNWLCSPTFGPLEVVAQDDNSLLSKNLFHYGMDLSMKLKRGAAYGKGRAYSQSQGPSFESRSLQKSPLPGMSVKTVLCSWDLD